MSSKKFPPRQSRQQVSQPLSDEEMLLLQELLDGVPAPLEPLDVSMLDGYLCGLLVQGQAVSVERWMPLVIDLDGRAPPDRFDGSRLQALVLRRRAELDDLIARRQWFDPWIFELDSSGSEAAHDEADAPDVKEAVLPWVAGFALALETFPGLLQVSSAALIEPLALIYRHIDLQDLDDADELLQEIESLEPVAELAEAVEELVRATLLLADLGRPQASAAPPKAGRPHRAGAAQRRPPRR